MITIKNEKYYTQQEVADMFGVTAQTVKAWRVGGKLIGLPLNERKWVYSETAIANFLNQGKSL